jgi:hypothetical protein
MRRIWLGVGVVLVGVITAAVIGNTAGSHQTHNRERQRFQELSGQCSHEVESGPYASEFLDALTRCLNAHNYDRRGNVVVPPSPVSPWR